MRSSYNGRVPRMWIDLEGLANLRDVGGLPTADGGKIVPGRLLRSDNLQTLTAADIEALLGLGLTDVDRPAQRLRASISRGRAR